MIHNVKIISRTRDLITQNSQCNFDSSFRGVHRSSEICAQRLQFCIISCFLAGYDRFAAHLIWPIVKCTCYSLPSQVFSKRCHPNHSYSMHGWHEASSAVLPSSCIAVLCFLWRRIHDTTIQQPETCRHLLSTYLDNNTASTMDCCTPSIVSKTYADLHLPANMLLEVFPQECCRK